MDPQSDPPETPREPVVDVYHGEEITDPYRWLEGAPDDDERVREWVAAQNAFTDAVLDVPAREHLRPRFEALAAVTDYGPVHPRGERYFQRVEAPDEDHAPLYTWTGAPDGRGAGRTLVDPNEWPAATSMNWYVPSPDGELVAYGRDEGGTEQYDVHVIGVGGEDVLELPDLGRVAPQSFAWADGGFYYVTTGGPGGGDQLEKAVRYHGLDGEDRLVADGFAPTVWPALTADRETGALVVTTSEMSAADELYRLVDGDLEGLLVGHDAQFDATVNDGTVYLVTDYGAPRKRVLAAPLAELADTDPDELREVAPEGEGVVQSATLAGGRLLVHSDRDACARLDVYDPTAGERVGRLPLPECAAVGEVTGNLDADEAFFAVEGFDRPPTVTRGEPGTGTTTALDAPDVDAPEVTVERAFVDSTDGAEVPVFVVHAADRDPTAGDPAPTLLYGYGGFRIPMTPGFDRFRGPFLEAGGVYAQVCARGGDEYGEPWHEAATRGAKQHTFDDVLAAAEWLVDAGYTAPERLGVRGGSNGGLSVGAAITQRPELFGAAVAEVPLADMLRFDEFLLGEAWTVEYGSPDDPEDFEALRAYSPYHNVAAREYPAVLLRTAAGDSRVHPAHARKLCARLQAAATSHPGRPVCLRTNDDTGHGVGKPTSMIVAENLDVWTFVSDRLGVDYPAPEEEE